MDIYCSREKRSFSPSEFDANGEMHVTPLPATPSRSAGGHSTSGHDFAFPAHRGEDEHWVLDGLPILVIDNSFPDLPRRMLPDDGDTPDIHWGTTEIDRGTESEPEPGLEDD